MDSASAKPAAPAIILQPRDLQILQGLFESRIMRRDHITALYFAGRDAAAKKRLQALLAADHVREQNPTRAVSAKAIYCLGHAGYEALCTAGALTRFEEIGGRRFSWESLRDRHQVSALTVSHELAVMDVRVAFHQALAGRSDLRLAECWTWPALFEFSALGRKARPDAFLRIERIDGERTLSRLFFLELDRGTETHATLLRKIDAYRSYNASAALAQFISGTPDPRCTFRVLFVFAGGGNPLERERRLWNAAHAMSSPWSAPAPGSRHTREPVKTLAWLTTLPRLLADALGNSWVCPVDYATLLRGTPYDPQVADVELRQRATGRDQHIADFTAWRSLVEPKKNA